MAARRRRFRIVAALGMALPALLALAARTVDISIMVGWAFALAASTFCPLFLLGIWWTRLTSEGAAAGIVIGGVLAIGAILAGALVGAQAAGGALDALLTQPAIISVPVAFAAMIIVSLATARPSDTRAQMLALHAPEGLGLEALERARA
jgi:Na+(H+)/acetate symporter ActP